MHFDLFVGGDQAISVCVLVGKLIFGFLLQVIVLGIRYSSLREFEILENMRENE
jgi:hypothetical protein